MDNKTSSQTLIPLLETSGNLLSSPYVDEQGKVYVSSLNGDIYTYMPKSRSLEPQWNTGGCPKTILFHGQQLLVCDLAHQAIIKLSTVSEQDARMEFEAIVKDIDGKPLIGPNSFVVIPPNQQQSQHTIIFTDSGPMGECAVEKPNGSIYQYFIETQEIICLLKSCLAHPSGVAYFKQLECIFVAETLKNRILRLVPKIDGGNFYISVFHEFSGKLGPTSLAVSQQQGYLFVGRYDFPMNEAQSGIISVMTVEGELLTNLQVQTVQITGLSLYYEQDEEFQTFQETLYITDKSMLYKLEVRLQS